jgi:hypothetical protein
MKPQANFSRKKMTNNKQSIRPIIANISSIENKSQEERFQNEVLRPIIKLQHDLIVVFFENHMLQKKLIFSDLNAVKKSELIVSVFSKDSQFKVELRGLIIGLFTVEEFAIYQNMSSEINKRIYTMIKERLLSTI